MSWLFRVSRTPLSNVIPGRNFMVHAVKSFFGAIVSAGSPSSHRRRSARRGVVDGPGDVDTRFAQPSSHGRRPVVSPSNPIEADRRTPASRSRRRRMCRRRPQPLPVPCRRPSRPLFLGRRGCVARGGGAVKVLSSLPHEAATNTKTNGTANAEITRRSSTSPSIPLRAARRGTPQRCVARSSTTRAERPDCGRPVNDVPDTMVVVEAEGAGARLRSPVQHVALNIAGWLQPPRDATTCPHG